MSFCSDNFALPLSTCIGEPSSSSKGPAVILTVTLYCGKIRRISKLKTRTLSAVC